MNGNEVFSLEVLLVSKERTSKLPSWDKWDKKGIHVSQNWPQGAKNVLK